MPHPLSVCVRFAWVLSEKKSASSSSRPPSSSSSVVGGYAPLPQPIERPAGTPRRHPRSIDRLSQKPWIDRCKSSRGCGVLCRGQGGAAACAHPPALLRRRKYLWGRRPLGAWLRPSTTRPMGACELAARVCRVKPNRSQTSTHTPLSPGIPYAFCFIFS